MSFPIVDVPALSPNLGELLRSVGKLFIETVLQDELEQLVGQHSRPDSDRLFLGITGNLRFDCSIWIEPPDVVVSEDVAVAAVVASSTLMFAVATRASDPPQA